MTSSAMNERPLVLITPDVEERPGKRGPRRVYSLDRGYGDAVLAVGGLPVVAPYTDDERALDQLIDGAQALVLSGGDFDVDPALFGEAPHEKLGALKPDRTRFERALLARAEAQGLPVLGVCGGMQLMNVARGGSLWQDLPSQRASVVEHTQAAPKHLPGHDVEVASGSVLARATSTNGALPVNTTHHQAVRHLGTSLLASAVAPDGLVEALEDASRAFFVGVQWHPEAMIHDERQRGIYAALVDAARGHHRRAVARASATTTTG